MRATRRSMNVASTTDVSAWQSSRPAFIARSHSGALAWGDCRESRYALELVEPGEHVGGGVVEVGQHAVVVVAGERDVLEAVAVEAGGELFRAARRHLLVVVAPECEQRAGQVTDERVCGQF